MISTAEEDGVQVAAVARRTDHGHRRFLSNYICKSHHHKLLKLSSSSFSHGRSSPILDNGGV